MKASLKELFIKYKNGIIQLIKNGFIGVINTLLDLVVYTFLDMVVGLPWIFLKKAISFSCGIINSFFMNRLWVFKQKKQKFEGTQLVKFITVNLVSYGASALLIYLLEQKLGINDSLGNVFAAPVTLLINFSGYKLWVFRHKPAAEKDPASETPAPPPEK